MKKTKYAKIKKIKILLKTKWKIFIGFIKGGM